jgi:hypothetical protein
MNLKEENLPIFSLIFSNGSFFFFWKSFCYFFMIFKKNISSFFINSIFIFYEKHHLSIKSFMEFFSFFTISQLGRIGGKKRGVFLDFVFLSIKNTKKNVQLEEIFSKMLFYLTFTLPSGFSLDFSIIPMLINEILDDIKILKKIILLEKMLLRFSKRFSRKDLIKNLIIKNFLRIKFNRKIDNYFAFLIEDLNFNNFLLKKNGRILIFTCIFLKNSSLIRFIYFSKWNLMLILKTKKKYKKKIEKIKNFFGQKKKKKKNFIFGSKNQSSDKFIIEFYNFFFILKKKAWALELNVKNVNLFKYRNNSTKNFELICDDVYRKDLQNFIPNLPSRYFVGPKKSIKNSQNINKNVFFYDSKFFIKIFFLKRKQREEIYSMFLIKSYYYMKNFLNIGAYKFSKVFQKNLSFFFDKFIREKIENFDSYPSLSYFFFAFYYGEKPIGTERIDFFFWRKKFLYKPFFKQKSNKNKNKTKFLKKFLWNLIKKKRKNFFPGYKIFSFFSRKLEKKEINKFFFFPKNKKKISFDSSWILSHTFWFFSLYFLKKFEYFAFFMILIVENSIKNFKNLSNWKQKFFNSFFSSFLFEEFINKKLFFYYFSKIFHLNCHRKTLFKWESNYYFRLFFYQFYENQKASFSKKDYFNIFIRNIW